MQLPPPILTDAFDGTAVKANWRVLPDNATAGFLAQPAGGSLALDGASVIDDDPVAPGAAAQFTATLGNAAYSSVGLAANLDPGPFAVFSTGPDGRQVYVTTNDGHSTSSPLRIAEGVDPTVPHTYGIDWTTTGFTFFVDGQQVATTGPTLTASAGLHLYATDFHYQDAVPGSSPTRVASALSVDAATLRASDQGTFESAPIDAGASRVTAATLTPDATTPAGTHIAYATRSASSASGLAAATYVPVAADGTVQSPDARFLQYRATLVDTDLTQTPTFTAATIAFTVGPVVAIDVGVDGPVATVHFTTGDASDTVVCRLDGASLAPCASPTTYDGLAVGSHTVTVQATDTAGTLDTASRTFTVTAPSAALGTPVVTGSGVTLPVTTDDTFASLACQLDGGAFAPCASLARYTGLTAGSHTVTLRATDSTGVGTASATFTIAAPRVTVGAAVVSGTAATVSFTSADPTAHVTCRLDTRAFAPCTSPVRFSGLVAGSHTVTVQATDTSGVGSASRTFTIAAARVGPKVAVKLRSSRLSRTGTVQLVLTCPKATPRCSVSVALTASGKTVAHGSVKVRGGRHTTLTLRLSKAARATIAKRGHLRVTAVVVAKDQAGGARTSRLVVTLR